MKFLPFAAILTALLCWACQDDEHDTWKEYTDWREANNAWLEEMQHRTNPDGSPYYEVIIPEWNPSTFVLMHWFNDRAETAGNLSPLITSTIDTRYHLHLYDGTPVDSSTNLTAYGKPGIFQAQLNQNIVGWSIALPQMHCGDTAEIIIPYGVAYGAQNRDLIKPYSNLRFNIRLENIAHYETAP